MEIKEMITSFKKGICFGIGILAVLLLCFGIVTGVYAVQQATKPMADTYVYAPDNQFLWVEENITCEQMGILLGTPVAKIEKGRIETGYEADGQPITKNGMRITFKVAPTTTALTKLDYEMGANGLTRLGGKSIVDALIKTDTITVIK